MGAQGNVKVKTKLNLQELVLNETDIIKNNIPHDELFMVQFSEVEYGPIWIYDLKTIYEAILKNNESEAIKFEMIAIRSLRETGEWTDIFVHPSFQRRKPQLVSNSDLKNGKIIYLKNGVHYGPVHIDVINGLINQKELLVTDLLSQDGGKTWKKIYEFAEFDRRNLKAKEGLPEFVKEENYLKGKLEVLKNLKENAETDAVVGLAVLNQLKYGKLKDTNIKLNGQEEITSTSISNSDTVNSGNTGFFEKIKSKKSSLVFTIFSIAFSLYGLHSYIFKSPPTQQINSKIGEVQEKDIVSPDVKTTNSLNKPVPKKLSAQDAWKERMQQMQDQRKKEMDTRRSDINDSKTKSFKDSESYKNHEEEHKDDYAYTEKNMDDGNIEQDSVRKKLNKQTTQGTEDEQFVNPKVDENLEPTE